MDRNFKMVMLIAGVVLAALVGMGLSHLPVFQSLWPVVLVAVIGFIIWSLKGTRKATAMSEEDRREALALARPADAAALYVVRTGFMGKAVGMTVSVDGQDVVQLKSPRFSRILLSAGRHAIKARFSGGAGTQNQPAETTLDCAAGDIHVLHFVPDIGFLKNALQVETWSLREADQKLRGIAAIAPDVARV